MKVFIIFSLPPEQLKSPLGRYASFTEEEWNVVLSHFTPLSVGRKTQLVKLEKVATDLYFIAKGAIRSYYLFDVEEVHSGFFFENSFTTSFSSYLNQGPSLQVVEALEESQLLCLKKSDYEKLNHTIVNMNILSRRLLEESLLNNERYQISLLFDEPEVRLAKLIKSQPQILRRVSQQYIASYLEIPLLALSKMIMNLQEERL